MRSPTPTLFEPQYDLVYASAIFDWTYPKMERLLLAYPDAIVGGTGPGRPLGLTVEGIMGVAEYEFYDYSLWPSYRWSLGFTQRGCRPKCPFCVVPAKEGKVVPVNTMKDLWRPGMPRTVLLLDNDSFGQPQWRDLIAEMREGRYRVSFNQGINVRLLTSEGAEALASVEYRDDQFARRRLYTAWDNLGDEKSSVPRPRPAAGGWSQACQRHGLHAGGVCDRGDHG